MKVEELLKELKSKYPNKNIVLDPPKNPTEIIVEIEPTEDNPESSIALAIVGKSRPHYHKKSTEIYEVIKGKLTLHIGNKEKSLKKGQKATIKPNVIHWVEGNEAWFLTHSKPGWTFKDHIVTET